MFWPFNRDKRDEREHASDDVICEVAHKCPKPYVDRFVVVRSVDAIRVTCLECDPDDDFDPEARAGFSMSRGNARALATLIFEQLGYKVTFQSPTNGGGGGGAGNGNQGNTVTVYTAGTPPSKNS